MPRISLAGFKDPVRRPRYIIWTGVIVLALIPLMILGIGASSTRWFCANGCHKVQDDLIAAYQTGTHSEISCLACHEPVNANPVTFMLLKGKAMIELYHAVSNTFKFPLNPGSALALNGEEMAATQCTQCHSSNRVVSPSPGIRIDHKVHTDNGVWCTVCHNRVAHPEKTVTLKLKDGAGVANTKHAPFTKMQACFRCHDLEGKKAFNGKNPPGKCSTCHTPGFQLKPPSHLQPGFYTKYGNSKGHAELAKEEYKKVDEAKAEAEKLIEEGVDKQLAEPVFYCSTCHVVNKFCKSCHGVPDMPHAADWQKKHGAIGRANPAICANCHAKSQAQATAAASMQFCNNCHHKWGDPNIAWKAQHFKIVLKNGASGCLKPDGCHNPTFCAHCHVRGQKGPGI